MSYPTLQLAERVASLRLEGVPRPVLAHARLCVLDALGCALRGSREPAARLVRALAERESGSPAASVWGCPLRTGSLQASLLNAVSAHALDFDDTHQGVPVHATAAVLPAAFAAAELARGTIGDLLTGYVAGAETAIRAGLALGRSHVAGGWHPTGTAGTLGAAAGAARVLGLPPEKAAQALGLAATQAAGFMKAVTGTMAKPLNAGKAAMNGLMAALLAQGGFTGPADILAAGSDFATAFGSAYAPGRLTFGQEHGWEVSNIAIKLFACCSLAQAALEAGRAIRREHSLDKNLISEAELRANPRQMEVAGIPRPRTGSESKFSLAYCAAVGLGGGTGGPGDFEDESLLSPAVMALMERMSVRSDPALSEVSARIRVRTAGGETLDKFVEVARGNPGNPASAEEVREKFRSLAEPVAGEASERIITLVLEDDSLRLPVKVLAEALAAPTRG